MKNLAGVESQPRVNFAQTSSGLTEPSLNTVLTEQKYCTLMIKGGICIAETNTLITQKQVQAGEIISFDFSSKINVNTAGGRQTLQGSPLVAGPSPDSQGNSAEYNGSNYNYIRHVDAFNSIDPSDEYTYSFWIYLFSYNKSSKNSLCCPIVQKGVDDFAKEKFDRFPMICVNEHTRKVKAYVSLADDTKFKDGIWTETIGRIPLQRWTQVAFTMSLKKISIFINGVRDSLQ
jgi:hypothetical protein